MKHTVNLVMKYLRLVQCSKSGHKVLVGLVSVNRMNGRYELLFQGAFIFLGGFACNVFKNRIK